MGIPGGVVEGAPVKLGFTNTTWTFQHAVLSFDANNRLRWYASGGGVAGSAIKLKACAATDPNCTWTINGTVSGDSSTWWQKIHSDSNPALVVGATNLTLTEPPLSLVNCPGANTSCNWIFQETSAEGYGYFVADAAGSNYFDGASVVDGTWSETRWGAITISPGDVPLTPCDQLCAAPKSFSVPPSYQSGSIGTAAACYETTSPLQGGNCTNSGSRSFTVNGTSMSCTNGNWSKLPPKRAGGYCVQVAAGTPSWTAFAAW
jgi:hypothetical protein